MIVSRDEGGDDTMYEYLRIDNMAHILMHFYYIRAIFGSGRILILVVDSETSIHGVTLSFVILQHFQLRQLHAVH